MSGDRWRLSAACQSVGIDLFFPEEGGAADVAPIKVCRGCPVRQQCLEWAIEVESGESYSFGVFGGVGAGARRAMINGRKRRNGRVA